jgi:hypothetical protein
MTIKISAQSLSKRLGVNDFEETILYRSLQRVPELSAFGPWIAGGAVRRTIECKALESDFDFFFSSKEQEEKFHQGAEGNGW